MIKRYDPEAREGLRLGVWDAYMAPNPSGDFVEYADHIEVVRGLVEALKVCVEIVEWVNGAYPNRPDWEAECSEALALARAAIAKATGEEG